MIWSKHSRRIDPISRSAKPFCQGEAGAIGLSRIPMARNPDHITWSSIPRKRLGYLTSNPLRCRVGCHVDPDEISAIKPYTVPLDDTFVRNSRANCKCLLSGGTDSEK